MSIRLNRTDFEALVDEAIESIPDEFRTYMVNVVIEVQDRPARDLVDSLAESGEIEDAADLMGIYLGTPLTERHVDAPPAMPDRVLIFQRNIESVCDSEDDLIDEIRITVLHEIGHHFGLSEERLDELGYG